jgi:hypothetical protein
LAAQPLAQALTDWSAPHFEMMKRIIETPWLERQAYTFRLSDQREISGKAYNDHALENIIIPRRQKQNRLYL